MILSKFDKVASGGVGSTLLRHRLTKTDVFGELKSDNKMFCYHIILQEKIVELFSVLTQSSDSQVETGVGRLRARYVRSF